MTNPQPPRDLKGLTMNPPQPTDEILIQVLSQGLLWCWVASNDRGIQLEEEGKRYADKDGFHAPGTPRGNILNTSEQYSRYEIEVSPLFNLYEVAAFLGRDGKVTAGDGNIVTCENYKQYKDLR